MKIKPQSKPAPVSVPAKQAAKPPPAAAAPTAASKGWQPVSADAAKSTPAALHAARKELTGHATTAVHQTIAEAPPSPVTHKHPLLERFGETLGMGLGVIVTEALALVPSWNKPVLDPAGKPVTHVEGADRVGNHDIRKRHEELVGPKVTALVNTLHPGLLHDLLEGLGKGATEAPGASYRLEAAVSDLIHNR